MTAQTFAYIRVSTVEQNTDRQEINANRTFIDKATGTNTNRPQLQELLRTIRKGDTIKCHSIDRLARSIIDLHQLVTEITNKGCSLVFIKENLTFTADKTNPTNELLLGMLGSVYQFENAIRRERQLEGIAQAKKKGVYNGRTTSMTKKADIKRLLKEGKSQRSIAKLVDVSLSTVQRTAKALKEEA